MSLRPDIVLVEEVTGGVPALALAILEGHYVAIRITPNALTDWNGIYSV